MRGIRTGLALLCVAALVVSCRRYDYHTVTIHVPAMKNEACAEIVRKAANGEADRCRAMNPEKGTEVDLAARTITITYDSLKLALKNIEYAIADAGFGTAEIPANKDAAAGLPAECRLDAPPVESDGTQVSPPAVTNERPR